MTNSQWLGARWQQRAGVALSAAWLACAAPARAEDLNALLGRMTLEEKLGQLTQWSGGGEPTGPKAAAGSEDDIRAGRVGSMIGLFGAETTRRLQQIAVEGSRLHVPMLFAFDVIHGFRTIFPTPLAETASWDVELAQRCARAAAVEATANGIHWTYAPMVDIARDPRWGRVVEGAGEDPYLGSAMAVARVRGFQGAPRAEAAQLMATVKHFAAYGAAEAGRDYNPADISERTLQEIYLPPFQAGVQAGAASVMTSFNEIAGIPMHAHRALVEGLLRKRWGFHGVVVSDYTGIRELMAHGVAKDRAEAGMLAMRATIDVDMVSSIYVNDIAPLVRSQQLPVSAVDAAVMRVLRAKESLGLFDDPYRYSDIVREQARTLTADARALAREAGGKSLVLLKNQGSLLPLRSDRGKLLVVGALADDGRAMLGSWSARGDAADAVTVLSGIRRAVGPEVQVTYAKGASSMSADRAGFGEALQAAKAADVIIAVVGETSDQNGEARSRTGLGLPGAQEALVEQLQATGKPLVVLLMGRPLAVPWIAEHVPAILEGWSLGVEMGNAVADVIFGARNPSGKLPITFPRNVGQVPIYYDHKNTGRPPSLLDPYTSKYIDVSWTPLYPFGYGLSYTTFKYEPPRLSATRVEPTGTLTVRVKVTNTGKLAGEEVVQLYLRDDVASVTRPVQALRGFARVMLQPGGSQELSFTLDREDFSLLDPSLQRVVEAGTFTVMVGGNSSEVQTAHFEVAHGLTLKGSDAGSAIPRFMRE